MVTIVANFFCLQLYLTRTMLESLVSEKTVGGRKLYKEIDAKHADRIKLFIRNSYYWSYLLKFADTLDAGADLSQFWFREFYLEMATGKRIQFPIETSIPWILTDYVLTSADPSLIECALYLMDTYNDAGSYSLKRFRKKHLYNECEAEVSERRFVVVVCKYFISLLIFLGQFMLRSIHL